MTQETDQPRTGEDTWWKGNLHTHSLWSDGDHFPEVIVQWYQKQGYDFLALTEHDKLSRGQKWINPETNRFSLRGGGMEVFEYYHSQYGDDWVETREMDGELEVRLKPMVEYRTLFERAGEFLLMDAKEIAESGHPVHVNATNIIEHIDPLEADSWEETIRAYVAQVEIQRKRLGQEMMMHLNHPNWRGAVTAEDMANVENLRLFELYNGHRGTLSFGGDDGLKSVERMWDIALAKRVEAGLSPLYGMATDDAHNYRDSNTDVARPGRGWVMVQSAYLTPERLMLALENGDFYSSSGVTLQSIESNEDFYKLQVNPEEGVEYTIQFIGTRIGYDATSEPFLDDAGQPREDRTALYSSDIGEILQETTGAEAEYEFVGDELYVRVNVISSKAKKNYIVEGEKEKAWLQPILPGK